MIKLFLVLTIYSTLSFAVPNGARPVYLSNEVSTLNSSDIPLSAGASFTGSSAGTLDYAGVVCSAKTDQNGTMYVDFSTDGVNWDNTLTFSVKANIHSENRLTTSKKYFRSRFTNTASSAQTYFRLQCLLGNFTLLANALNANTAQDADAIVTKSIPAEILMAESKMSGYAIVNKFGTNQDVDTGSVPEDVWELGGEYTGWATAAEKIEVFSSDANDTAAGTGARTVRVTGLDANYNIIAETITLNGITGVQTTNNFIRAHTASTISAGSGGVNAGTITFRQATTTANIFLSMIAGRNQTNCSCYTVPASKTAYMRKLQSAVSTNLAASLEGNIWTRSFGGVFRSRRPFFIGNAVPLIDEIFGGLVFTEKSDIIIRITASSLVNASLNGGYDLILVDNNGD